MSEPDKALSLVGPILAAHQEVVTTSKKSLDAAIKCGELLIKAKEAVGHGKWSGWLAKHCSDISDRTARQYMSLADPDNAAALEEAKRHHGADLGVRSARAWLYKPKTTEQKAQAKATREQTKAIQNEIGRLAAKGQKAPDLTDLLMDVAADEVFQALKDAYWDTDEKLTELEKLAKLINVHLAQMRVSKSAATASAPAIAAQPAVASPPPSSGGSEFVRRI